MLDRGQSKRAPSVPVGDCLQAVMSLKTEAPPYDDLINFPRAKVCVCTCVRVRVRVRVRAFLYQVGKCVWVCVCSGSHVTENRGATL